MKTLAWAIVLSAVMACATWEEIAGLATDENKKTVGHVMTVLFGIFVFVSMTERK